MRKVSFFLAVFLLVSCLMISCDNTEPVMLDISGQSGGVGREPQDGKKPTSEDDSVITVCLDPGHGFDDVGTDSKFLGDLAEKDITLSVTTLVAEKLRTLGYEILFTHDGEAFPKSEIDDGNSLFNPKERISYANTLDIDFYLSIHCDSFASDASVMGTRVYYSADTSFESKAADAATRMKDWINQTLPDEKKTVVKKMDAETAYYVLRASAVPSVLIELGFVTNKTDAENMLSENWQDSIATGIAAGLHAYFTE